MCYRFQAQQMCSHCWVETIRVVMVWCARCELKDSITSQTCLSLWGRHQRWMIIEKHVNNNQWKPWHDRANIYVSSNSLPSTQELRRHTHYGGMGEFFEKCWIITQSTPPLLIIILYYGKGAHIWEGEHNLHCL